MDAVVVEVREQGRSVLTLLLRAPLVVGRDCDGLLLADSQISRRHVELRPVGDELEVTDLSSTNGTYIGVQRIDTPQFLQPGETVRLGSTTITLAGGDGPNLPLADLTTSAVDDGPAPTSIELVAELVSSSRSPVQDHEHRHGTVTIVFSDIEGSTNRTASVGDDAWFALLSEHNELVGGAASEFGGTVVKNQGDGFMFTFPSARRALQSTVEMQRRLDADLPEIRIRVGMHTGEAIVDDDGDLFGWHVNFAARVAGRAEGGQILVSALTRAILETRGDIDFGEPVSAELKGISGRHLLHPVAWAAPPTSE
jgi:class 3 adenylate cyclase